VVRAIQRLLAVAFSLGFISAAFAQQTDATVKVAQQTSASSVALLSYAAGHAAPWRRVQTRTESGGREVVTETIEEPGTDGRSKTLVATTTETVREGPGTVRTRRDVFGTDSDGRPKLIETTQADQETLPDGTSRTVENTWTADINGRLELRRRQLQETKPAGSNVKQTDVTIYRPGTNDPLRETERVQQVERQVSSDLLQNESTRSVLDFNGRWQVVEMRNLEVRTPATTERLEEETVHRLGTDGGLSLDERTVTRRSAANGQNEVVIETYSHRLGDASDKPLELNQRLRLTTVATADGGRQTTQEVETRNRVAPNEPLRIVERSVETVRPLGADRWETQRQAFALDGNGRLAPVITENGEAAGK